MKLTGPTWAGETITLLSVSAWRVPVVSVPGTGTKKMLVVASGGPAKV